MTCFLPQNLKDAYSQVLIFRQQVFELRGSSKDPWDFEKYNQLIVNCLKLIEPLAEKNLPVRILEEAYRIQINPLFFYGKKVVFFSHTTQNKASLLTQLFEKACLEPSADQIKCLSVGWLDFANTLQDDMKLTKDYFSR
jgi:hypothetical protein